MGSDIEKKLDEAGYRMLGAQQSKEDLITDILKTKDIRYLKAIPFLIYKYSLNINNIRKKTKDITLLDTIINLTSRIFTELNIQNDIKAITDRLKDKYSEEIEQHYAEFKEEFELQLRMDKKSGLLIDKQKIDEERDLHYNLSQLFTKKERQMIKRLQEEKPISRTDYEYYSRKTKKKLRSILNLHDFAKTIYSKTPAYDEELFRLKKELERYIKEKNISITQFFTIKDRLSITYTKKQQPFNTILNIKNIKEKDIIALLDKYKEHDFR